MARTCAGLLSSASSEFVAAVESAEKASLPGAEYSILQLAMSWNLRAVREGDSARAIEELGAVADALTGHGFQMSNAEMRMLRSDLEVNLDRNDASIDSMYKAIASEKEFLVTAREKQSLAPLPPVLGEKVDETDIRMTILYHLFQLKVRLEMREVSEGMVVYSERRATVEKDMDEFLTSVAKEWPQGASNFHIAERAMLTKMKNDDLKHGAAQVDRFNRAESCTQILRSFHATRADLEHADTPMPMLRGLTMAGFCDPDLREQAQAQLAKMHPVENIKAALAQAPDPLSPQRALIFLPAVADASELCRWAEKADAGALLEQWSSGLDQALAGMNISELPIEELTYFRARSRAIQGDFTSAKRLLASIESDEPFWSYQAGYGLRQDVLESRVEAEVHSGDAESALLASERARADRENAEEVASGVTVSDPNSAEAAMLLRKAAVEGDVDQQRLAELQHAAVAGGDQFRLPTMNDLHAGVNSLPSGITALIFHPLRNELAIWRIDAGGKPRLIQVPVRENDLVRLAGQFRGRLAGSEAGWEAPAEALYKLLIAPAGPNPLGRTIAIFGIGRLGGIPLEVLRDGQGHSLFMGNPLVYVSALADTRRWPVVQHSRSRSLVAGINAGGLTAPESEATAVASRLGAVALTGSSVTMGRIREALPQARFIHLATHGVLDAKNPYRSYLAMADGQLETWVLFRDIAGVDLMVLSACDTKLGPREYMKQTSSDESSITGFVLRAGARRIVSSLWGATDAATKSLMESFYSELDRNPHDPARALQSAKLQVAGPGRHPYTFANFVLSV